MPLPDDRLDLSSKGAAAMSSSKSIVVDLLNRARDGDEAARDELFRRCRNYVLLVARAHVEQSLRQKVDASDLVQQTLLEAHTGFADFHGHTAEEWLAWLRRILVHNAADCVRHYRQTDKRQQRREVPLRAGRADDSAQLGWEPADPGESPSELVMRMERDVQIADGIAELSEDHREVIVLRSLERLSFDEVARRMGRSRPAVQMLWMRAIRSLQKVMEQE
jgi:RNA polymerase sigma-70 factor, ECF subfamily